MKTKLFLVLITAWSWLGAANLIHQFDFNGDLSDAIGVGTLMPVHTSTSGFDAGAWNWMASSSPGGGLLLGTQLPNARRWSIRTVFRYNSLNISWTKIISVSGLTSLASGYYSFDGGLYFNGVHFAYYDFVYNTEVSYTADTWYDLILTRDLNGWVKAYIAPYGQQPVLRLQFQDLSNVAIPSSAGGYSYYGMFYDDTHTTAEWTAGGSVNLIQVWDDAINLASVQNPAISRNGGTVNLSWDVYPSAVGYNVYASDSPDGGWLLIGSSPTNSYGNVPGEDKKFYQIRAVLD